MIANLIRRLRATEAERTSAVALQDLQEARGELDEARSLEAAALAAFEASKTDPDAKATSAARDKVLGAELLRARAEAVVELAQTRLQEAQAREAEAARVVRYREAEALSVAAQRALGEYPQLAEAIRAILGAVAAADVAILKANGDLPAGAIPLQHPEQLARGLAGEGEVVLGRKKRPERWAYAGQHAAWGWVQESSLHLIEKSGRRGVLNTSEGRHEVELRPDGYDVTVMEARSAFTPATLASTIQLPGFGPGAEPVWTPTGPAFVTGGIGQEGGLVLEQIGKREVAARQAPTDPRGLPGPVTRHQPANGEAAIEESAA